MVLRFIDDFDLQESAEGRTPNVGEIFKVLRIRNENNGAESYNLSRDTESGWGGNMDAGIKRYHGWRGTTNNRYREALGVRRVLEVKHFKNGKFAVTLSEDLHPDWE